MQPQDPRCAEREWRIDPRVAISEEHWLILRAEWETGCAPHFGA
jgi:hypothetical protein